MQSKFTNKLIGETSPYLLQHAHNPVEWYPWGEEAFEKAKAEDKPLLVSIGYSACHWCHVMEHESFEDEQTAAIMNENFINIKVDMEERPDVDQIYMNFVQITTGRGGWPMNVFITADKRPFFGGTYFPPSPRYGMPSWLQVLMGISEAWHERRDELLRSSDEILVSLKKLTNTEMASGVPDEAMLEAAFKSYVRTFDARNGGWGGAPKFPQSMSMDFLLRYWKRTGDENALHMVRHSAEKMAQGGIYDQLGGGFHRYAVDAVWLVPHFEKMLYDNAQLIRLYLHLFQITREESFKQTAIETLEYVCREMLDSGGGFYSSQDADSEGEEGKFFVWSPEEIAAVLGDVDAEKFCKFYDVTTDGNFEGKNILNIKTPESGEKEDFKAMRQKLFDDREARIKPFRDEKVLTAWNGLMLSAFAEAGAILNEDKYIDIAKKNADFLLNELTANGGLLRTWKDGKAKLNAYIEDHANLADGLIELFQVTGEDRYLTEAKRLADVMITEFWDNDAGGFFFTSNDHEEMIVRNKDFYDNASPSGNSVAADVLLKLAKFYGAERYERFAAAVLRIAASQIKAHPQGFGRMLATAEFHISSVKEVVIAGDKGNELERAIFDDYLPNTVVGLIRDPRSSAGSEIPLLQDRKRINEAATVYVCQDFVCSRPVTEPEELHDLLG